MHSVTFVFDLDNLDPEDTEIQNYLSDNELQPRNSYTDIYEDKSNCHVMEFGGCYLGRHLEAVAYIQRESVETELLTDFVKSNVDFDKYGGTQRQVIELLVQRLRNPEAFTVKNDELSVNLSKLDIERELREIAI